MAKLTIVFGILLIFLGIAGFVATGSTHPTALIPSVAGLLFVLFGALANSNDSKKRMLWMHIAVTIALLLFLGTIPADIDVIRLSRGTVFPHPIAVLEKAGMSLLCLLFVGLCVRSFIEARRQRLAV
jgi:fucose 4-O-acetylase-like acetyltransferase